MTTANVIKERTLKALPDYLKKNRPEKLALKSGVGLQIIEDMAAGLDCEDHLVRQVFKIINPNIMEGIYSTNDLKTGQNAANAATEHKLCIGLTADTGMGKSMLAELLTNRDNA